jgi:hypothetical protein
MKECWKATLHKYLLRQGIRQRRRWQTQIYFLYSKLIWMTNCHESRKTWTTLLKIWITMLRMVKQNIPLTFIPFIEGQSRSYSTITRMYRLINPQFILTRSHDIISMIRKWLLWLMVTITNLDYYRTLSEFVFKKVIQPVDRL